MGISRVEHVQDSIERWAQDLSGNVEITTEICDGELMMSIEGDDISEDDAVQIATQYRDAFNALADAKGVDCRLENVRVRSDGDIET